MKVNRNADFFIYMQHPQHGKIYIANIALGAPMPILFHKERSEAWRFSDTTFQELVAIPEIRKQYDKQARFLKMEFADR